MVRDFACGGNRPSAGETLENFASRGEFGVEIGEGIAKRGGFSVRWSGHWRGGQVEPECARQCSLKTQSLSPNRDAVLLGWHARSSTRRINEVSEARSSATPATTSNSRLPFARRDNANAPVRKPLPPVEGVAAHHRESAECLLRALKHRKAGRGVDIGPRRELHGMEGCRWRRLARRPPWPRALHC